MQSGGVRMMLLSVKQMREIERIASARYEISGYDLMRNAAQGIYDAIKEYVRDYDEKHYLIFCGKGNNGGDGYGLAWLMRRDGLKISVFSAGELKDENSDAAAMKNNYLNAGGVCLHADIFNPELHVPEATVIVDALFGTGLNMPISETYADLIEAINCSGAYVVSADIPSGLNCDNGLIMGAAVKANMTVTFCRKKIAHILKRSHTVCGDVIVKDIGIPQEAFAEIDPVIALFEEKDAELALPKNRIDEHKGSCGKVLVIGGSRTMSGAPVLSATAALRSGAGIVKLLIPEGVFIPVVSKTTELMCVPMKESIFGTFSKNNLNEILESLYLFDAIVLGCGMSADEDTSALVSGLIANCTVPMVLDADGLNILASSPDLLYHVQCDIVLTPHEVEMSRLCDILKTEIETDRIGVARDFARKYACTVVLKGTNTITASAEGDIFINSSGNPGMATGGSGDVLSGVIGAFLARGLDPFRAASAGVYIHGTAGDIAADRLSQYGMIATDIIGSLPAALKKYDCTD